MWRSYNVDILPCKRCTRLVSCIRGNLSDLKAQSLFMAGVLVWLAMAIGRRAADKELFIPLQEPHPHQVAQVKPPGIPAKSRYSSPWNVCYGVPADDASVPNSASPMSVTSCRLGLVMCVRKMHCSRIG